MNKVILMGRLTRDPEVKHIIPNHPEEDERVVARYTLAVDRGFKRQDEPEAGADFISCVCFQKSAIFAEKFLKKGMKVVICGRIQTGSYTNSEARKVYTTDVVVDEHEFAEPKSTGSPEAIPDIPDIPGLPF